jgi:DNA-binding SARP family transcriptional activator
LLGRFEVVREDSPVPVHAWRRRRPADLLKLVALAPGHTLTREQAIAALWPDKEPASGANNLHRALYDLRQILGGRWVNIERGQLLLDPSVWLDVEAFERAAATGTRETLAEAVALYRGDLVPDAREPWLVERRASLRRRFVETATPLARAAAAAGDSATAVPLLRRIIEVDPLGEEAHRELMRLLAGTGRRAEALRAYDVCEGALRAAGRGAPSEETRALRQEVQLGAIGPAHGRQVLDGARRASRRLLGSAEAPPVRGRNSMLLVLEALVERGSGALVILGERGVGKTRLALEGARFAQGRGAAVLSATAVACPGSPYGVFVDLFRHERESLGGDPLAALPGVSSDRGRLAIHAAVVKELAVLAEGRPLFLLLDDLHAADESSLNLVHALALRAPELRLMIVATCRDDEVHEGTPIQSALAHLDVARLARGLRLPRLSMAGTREQLADLLGAPPDEPLLAQVYRVTDGSPFLVEEAVRAHQESRQVPADPAVALRARVTRLGPRAEALLAAAAVVGRRFEFEVVRPVTGLSAHDAIRTLEECLAARLLDEDGTGYLFRHDLVRESIYDGLTATRRTALHASVADALEAGPAASDRPEVLALHRRRAGQLDRALRHLVAAGHRAAACACLAEALGFFNEALELVPRAGADPALRRELLDSCGRVQLALGETAGSARSFAQAAAIAPQDGAPQPGPRARTWRLAALSLAASGNLRDAGAAIQDGLSAAGEAADEERAALLHLAAQLHFHEGRTEEAAAAGQACAEAAERAGDVDLVARGRDMAAIARTLAGEPPPPLDDQTLPADRLAQDVAPEHLFDVHLALWDHDLLGDRGCAEVARAAAVLAARARLRHAPEAIASGRYGEAAAALGAGQLDAAEVLLRDARDLFAEVGSGMGEAMTLERLATLLTQLGRFEEAGQLLAEGVVLAERGMLRRHVLTRIHAAEIRSRLAAGQTGQAESAAREASGCAARHGECVACDAAFRPESVRVALAFGRIEDADAEAHALEEIARQRGGRGVQAVARLARARVLAARERTDDALVMLAQARAGFLAGGFRYDAARTVRLESRLRGSLPEAWRSLDALLKVDADA